MDRQRLPDASNPTQPKVTMRTGRAVLIVKIDGSALGPYGTVALGPEVRHTQRAPATFKSRHLAKV